MLLLQFAHHLVEIVVQLEQTREKEMLATWEPEAGVSLLAPANESFQLNNKIPHLSCTSVQGPVPPPPLSFPVS